MRTSSHDPESGISQSPAFLRTRNSSKIYAVDLSKARRFCGGAWPPGWLDLLIGQEMCALMQKYGLETARRLEWDALRLESGNRRATQRRMRCLVIGSVSDPPVPAPDESLVSRPFKFFGRCNTAIKEREIGDAQATILGIHVCSG